MIDILDYFDIPDNCKALKKLKTYLLEQYPLKANEKKSIKNDTKSIVLHYILNQSKINISKYEDEERRYVEIYVIVIEVYSQDKIKQLSNIIQSIFQKPILLIFQENENIAINITPKRINRSDTTKLVSEETIVSKWINLAKTNELEKQFLDSLNIHNQPFTDFQSLYNSYLDKIIAFNASEYSGTLNATEETKEVLNNIRRLEASIEELKSTIRKETNFNEKVNLNIQLKKTNDKLEELKGRI